MTLPHPQADLSQVVLVGSSTYQFLPDLPSVRNNTRSLASILSSAETWGVPARNVNVIGDPQSLDEVLEPLYDAAENALDTLVFYYSGHGLVDEIDGGLLLALRYTRPHRGHTALPYDWIRRALAESPARRRIVILDCCYGGRALGLMSAPGTALADAAVAEGTFLVAAAGENARALAPPGATYTAFTGELLSTLEGGDPTSTAEYLTLDATFRLVSNSLRAKSHPIPQKRDRNTAGELPLFVNRSARLGPSGRLRRRVLRTVRDPLNDRHGARARERRLRQPQVLALTVHDPDARTYLLREGDNLIGRAQACQIRLQGYGTDGDRRGGRYVDHQQSLITVRDGAAAITDLGSLNGTWVNGTKILTSRRIGARDKIYLATVPAELGFVQSTRPTWHPPPAAGPSRLLQGPVLIDTRNWVVNEIASTITTIGGLPNPTRGHIYFPDSGLNRLHAILEVAPSGVVIRDEPLAAGIHVNGEGVAAEQLLSNGDVVDIANLRLLFRFYGSGLVSP